MNLETAALRAEFLSAISASKRVAAFETKIVTERMSADRRRLLAWRLPDLGARGLVPFGFAIREPDDQHPRELTPLIPPLMLSNIRNALSETCDCQIEVKSRQVRRHYSGDVISYAGGTIYRHF